MRRVTVGVEPVYDVVIGPGALDGLASLLDGWRRFHIVTQQPVLEGCAESVEQLAAARGPLPIVIMDDGERAKTLATVESLCRSFAEGGLVRGDVVVALGGGVVGDTAGFAAAVYHRGIDVLQAPTTLLAQVDAAIGGKTAVNLPEGKNLVGAFHQPVGVLADTSVLAALPEHELRCGLGEVAKYALMPQGTVVRELAQQRTREILARDPETLSELVAACVAMKAEVVAADPEERSGLRAFLNFGHTLAHALETTGRYGLAHGEAVAIGLLFATELARVLERVDDEAVQHAHQLIERLGLPTTVPDDGVDAEEVIAVMQRDKKSKGGLTFVLPTPDGLETVDDPPARAVVTALRAVGVRGDERAD